MPDSRHRGAAALDKSLDLLAALLAEGETRSLADIADELGLAASTAQRLGAVMVEKGFLARLDQGRRTAGPRLVAIMEGRSERAMLDQVARGPLRDLARATRATAHLGKLEGGMVTYVLKEDGGHPVMTREGAQLEAYASGIGKVLLGHVGEAALAEYLDNGPFVALTPNTLTDPEALMQEVRTAAGCGFARDNSEIEEGLYCLAAPVVVAGGTTPYALSISRRAEAPLPEDLLPLILSCADRIGKRLGKGR
ncbi:MAG: IclR family transcriptional regulator [Pseudomonadota bacterium]|jgi:IclR family acetate operon transcriptional repressor